MSIALLEIIDLYLLSDQSDLSVQIQWNQSAWLKSFC